MPDITSKETFAAGQWFVEEIGPDERVGVFSDVPMTLEALRRLKALVDAKVTQMSKGALVSPPP
jgi:hypothetical protein